MEASWRPHPGMQTEFCSRGEQELLGGGAAGPGKTDCLIGMALRNVWHPRYHGLILRRTNPRLDEIVDRTLDLYPKVVPGAEWKDQKHRWNFPSGARITLGHCQHENDKRNYQGKEYHFIGFDELTEFTETQYKFIAFSRRRRTVSLPFRTLIRATSNPGGIGHKWVKERFRIGIVPPGQTIREEMVLPDGEIVVTTRAFIPGRLSDNPSIVQSEYIASLMHLPEVDRMRLLDGIWDVFEGQAFRDLNADIHSFDFDPPPEWETFTIFDWGFAKPSVYQVWHHDFDGRLWMSREKVWRKPDTEDEGVRRPAPEIARDILEFEREHGITPRVRLADPNIWSALPAFRKGETFGKSIHDDFMAAGLVFLKANNDRIHGRQQVHHRLALDESGKPMMFVHERCGYWWETIPLLVESEKNPEDIDHKDAPDHAYDCTRYACQHHPMRPKVQVKRDTGSFQAERRKLIAAKKHAARYGVDVSTAYGRLR